VQRADGLACPGEVGVQFCGARNRGIEEDLGEAICLCGEKTSDAILVKRGHHRGSATRV
jgi:hypothetical protein